MMHSAEKKGNRKLYIYIYVTILADRTIVNSSLLSFITFTSTFFLYFFRSICPFTFIFPKNCALRNLL